MRVVGIVVRGHLVGPVEHFRAVFLGNPEQAGDGLQRQLARHLLNEIAGSLSGRILGDVLGPFVELITQPSDGTRGEAAGNDLAQPRVVRGVHVQDDEPLDLDVLTFHIVAEPRDRPVFPAREDIAAQRHLLDMLVLGDHPVAAIVEAADSVGLFLPPNGSRLPKLLELLDRKSLGIDLRVGEVETGRKAGVHHVELLWPFRTSSKAIWLEPLMRVE
ncbi:Uncharacterised protein [Mycobacteroides abscessus subsp. massiliense]|nr:Uncharacterised protein [Mycobacteroides abscessus subsp. massiliense]